MECFKHSGSVCGWSEFRWNSGQKFERIQKMKKTFRIIVMEFLAILFGMTVCSAQAQMMAGNMIPTDRGGNPIYANQEGYYGLNGGCASGNCGNHAVGPMVAGGYAGMVSAAPCGIPCTEPCGVPCAEPCGVPCGEICGPCETCGPCLPCLPCFAGCGPCGGCGNGGILGRIWNGRNYWQGPGCSERVIDELRKSWRDSCSCCDVTGEMCGNANTIGSGLRSSQILGAGGPYTPVKMNAGQPEKGFYSAPSPHCAAPFSGGCKSCQGGMNFTAIQPQQPQQMVYAQSVQQNYAPQQNYASQQNYAQPVQQTFVQPVSQPMVQPTYVQPAPQSVQPVIQPVQYQEPIRKASKFQKSGVIHYRSNYSPSSEVPGYLKAQMNAEKEGIGFETAAKALKTENVQSAWRVVNSSGTKTDSSVTPVAYNQVSDSMETVVTPAPRTEGSFQSASPVQSGAMAYPAGVPMDAVVAGDCGGACGMPCGDYCAPCGDCCEPCGGCGLYGAGCCGGAWPGLIPLTGKALRFTGHATYRVGRAAVIETGLVARGSLRAVGTVFWNPNVMGPVFPRYAAGPVAVAGPVDPVYAENDMYLNASSTSEVSSSLQASTLPASTLPASNLYENNYYPQNYTVVSDTVVNPAVPSHPVAAVSASASPSASLLSYQTQRVMLEDGTEVILEHDAMTPQNRSLNASTQYMAANDSSAPALSTAVPAVIPVGMSSQVTSNVTMKPADVSTTEEFPIVESEQPQIQLAPGEVLVSQQDFILEPAGIPSSSESNELVPVEENIPLEKVQSHEENVPVTAPVRDAKVTKVSFIQPVSDSEVSVIPATVPSEERETASGWKVRVTPGSESLLGLKSATPIQ